MRQILIFAALLLAFGSTLAKAEAAWGEPARLEPTARRAQAQELRYEPSKRDREGDDEEQDEPRH
ncbi:hypothetical protein [Bradyrhizobium sp. STM 3809]|uniref:hypothetical protein n=1 Tax=Bradyrhizobium sp. STM 3809 TaxID=551936 RepID=UPI00024065ED|nr:hypothetical protein [Bradyrhizobium sp. STM 3809]CCD99729.1 exported hypothetical protein [Bradyrhizobium sp. STM 3809]